MQHLKCSVDFGGILSYVSRLDKLVHNLLTIFDVKQKNPGILQDNIKALSAPLQWHSSGFKLMDYERKNTRKNR